MCSGGKREQDVGVERSERKREETRAQETAVFSRSCATTPLPSFTPPSAADCRRSSDESDRPELHPVPALSETIDRNSNSLPRQAVNRASFLPLRFALFARFQWKMVTCACIYMWDEESWVETFFCVAKQLSPRNCCSERWAWECLFLPLSTTWNIRVWLCLRAKDETCREGIWERVVQRVARHQRVL